MHAGSAVANRDGALEPDNLPLTMVKVGWFSGTDIAVGAVFAEPPDAQRDLPNDILAGNGTCTITARAGHGGDEVVSPVAALKVRPVDTVPGAITGFRNRKPTSAVAHGRAVGRRHREDGHPLRVAVPRPRSRGETGPAVVQGQPGTAQRRRVRSWRMVPRKDWKHARSRRKCRDPHREIWTVQAPSASDPGTEDTGPITSA